ncbi:MAG: anthranilate phosphoribosyltransferase [Limisphaera sp.]
MLETLTRQLLAGESLGPEQVRAAVDRLVNEQVSAETKAEFLTALARKGETPDEIAGFARELRARAVVPPVDPEWRKGRVILDVVGTGGDRAGTFNISTAVALLCAAAGVPVAKHGNRAVTSRAGSADVLEALGIPIQQSPAEAARALQVRGFAFFFAPLYHPAFRHIAPARRLCAERGQRTIFNYLGPLLNPVVPDAQLMGVPRPDLCAPLARVLHSLGVRRGLVVCGEITEATGAKVYLDEASPAGSNTVAGFGLGDSPTCAVWEMPPRPSSSASLEDLRGGDAAANAALLERLLRGEDRGPRREAVLYNAAAALWVAGAATSLTEGWAVAERVLAEGRAAHKLEELRRG